jgi:hypothetical protein
VIVEDHQGLFDEYLQGAVVGDSASLYGHRASYYHRADLLPALDSNETLRERFFGGVKKPIFTSSTADNHLVTFAEVLDGVFGKSHAPVDGDGCEE